MALSFACFDADGDGHLDKAELKRLLRGTIEPAVCSLHAAVDFAAFAGEPELGDIAEESAGAASLAESADGKVRVELKTGAGVATLLVPQEALTPDALAAGAGAALSLDSFVDALASASLAAHDADGNATLEVGEFVGFAKKNPFLQLWFGPGLTGAPAAPGASWKDADVA